MMSTVWPLLQDETRRLIAQLRPLVDELAGGDEGQAMAQWQRRLKAFQGAVKVLGETPMADLVQRLQGLWPEGQPPAASVPLAHHWLDALQASVREPFAAAMTHLAERLSAPPDEEPEAHAGEPVDPRLLALFAQEVDDKCAAMERLLLALEQQPDRIELIAPLMRAAHSIKGAARAVRNDAAVALAHAMEDRLSAVQKSGAAPAEALLELALRCVDGLRDLGHDRTGAVAHSRQLRQKLAAAAATEPGAAPLPAAELRAPGAGYIDVEDTDPVLRVKASHLGELVALAGTGMVENRRLQPFGERQQRLRRELGNMQRLLDEMHQALGAPGPQTGVGAQVANLRSQLSHARLQANQWLDEFGAYQRESSDLIERLFHGAARTRLRPFSDIAEAYPRMVRDLARRLGRKAHAVLRGDQLAVDRDVLDRLDAPLTHLLRNAVDHGIEPPEARRAAGKPEEGTLTVTASYRAGLLALEVADDGAGIDFERVRERLQAHRNLSDAEAAALDHEQLADALFQPGFSTRDDVSEISGRGVGLDVVRQMLKQLDGSVRLDSIPGAGTRFSLLVPISRTVTRAVVVGVAGETYAFPLLRIERLLRAEAQEVLRHEGMHYVRDAGQNIGLLGLAEVLGLDARGPRPGHHDIVVIAQEGRRAGFLVDSVLGEFDLATRPLDPRLGRVADVSAMAVMPDGQPVVMLDVEDLMHTALERERAQQLAPGDLEGPVKCRRVLVVDDSISVRELVRQLLVGRGYEVQVCVDGMDAWARLRDWACDLVVTDVDMPRMDGIELTRSIKQDPRLRALPVVIVSYRDRPEDRARGLEVNADAYLTKSDFQEHGFLDVVQQLIGDAQVAA
jgi:two-component system sensor histidine kinase and response regulator WspE